jgi:NADPH:quinone reductase-like Zn-dependent oxidoreductase
VIDTVGGDLQRRSLLVIRRGGVLISAVSQPDAALAEKQGVRASFILVQVTTAALQRIGALLEQGLLRARVGTILPLSEAQVAHEMLEGQRPHPPGKIVLKIESQPGSQP